MSCILLIEDDESLSSVIEFTLIDEGYEVLRAGTIAEGKRLFLLNRFDLIILDVGLPDGIGYDLCKEIRKVSNVPIIFLTAINQEINIVLGLEIGGDDYITKPFRVKELLARVKVLIRRNLMGYSLEKILISGNLVLNASKATVKKLERELTLTSQEYKLLMIFMSNPRILLTRNDLLSKLIEGTEVFFDENTLSVYIKRIREKIEDDPRAPQYIITHRGVGYRWNKDVEANSFRIK